MELAALNFGAALRSVTEEAQELLRRERYVSRLLYKEGADPRATYHLYQFLDHEGFTEEYLLKDDQIVSGRRLVLIGNAGSGKTLTLIHAFLKASDNFFNDSGSPIPFALNLRTDLASDNNLTRALDFKYKNVFTETLGSTRLWLFAFSRWFG